MPGKATVTELTEEDRNMLELRLRAGARVAVNHLLT